MDADEEGPTHEELGGPDAAAVDKRTEAGSRAADPAARGLAGRTIRASQKAALHFERAAVHWLAAQREPLDAWPPEDSDREAVLGALADVALLVGVRVRRDRRPLDDDYSTLVTMLAQVAARVETRQLLRQDERALGPLVAVQGALRANRQADPGLAQALDSVVSGRSVPGLARTTRDQIVLRSQLRSAGVELPCPHPVSLLASCSLADDAVALNLARHDQLALTTVILTASDFGRFEIGWPAGTTAPGIDGALREWLVLALAEEDAELVATLLSGLTGLGGASDELTRVARRWLHGWQESNGRVEGRPPIGPTGGDSGPGTWAAAAHATAMTALDSLLLRTQGIARVPREPIPAHVAGQAGRTHDLTQCIMAAADWLDAVLPGTHVQGRLWISEAWLALGDEDEARRQLLGLAEDPDIAFTVLRQSRERAVHLAALLLALDVNSPPLTDVCDDVAALVDHPEAARVLLGADKASYAVAEAPQSPDVRLTAGQEAFCVDEPTRRARPCSGTGRAVTPEPRRGSPSSSCSRAPPGRRRRRATLVGCRWRCAACIACPGRRGASRRTSSPSSRPSSGRMGPSAPDPRARVGPRTGRSAGRCKPCRRWSRSCRRRLCRKPPDDPRPAHVTWWVRRLARGVGRPTFAAARAAARAGR